MGAIAIATALLGKMQETMMPIDSEQMVVMKRMSKKMKNLAAEVWRPAIQYLARATQEVLLECRNAYNDWNRKVKYARDGVNRDDALQGLPGGQLDGDYWQYFA